MLVLAQAKQPVRQRAKDLGKHVLFPREGVAMTTFNRNYFEGKWQQTRGLIRQRWAELTDDDLNKLHGRYEQFVGLLQEKYGYTRQKAEAEIQATLNEWESGAETAVAHLDRKIADSPWKALATTLVMGFAAGLWVGFNNHSSS
jgi:uncharacterized protein YjbJ (UPF0337 family)